MNRLVEKFNHLSPLVKNAGDGGAIATGLVAVFAIINPILQAMVLILTGLWFWWRVKVLKLEHEKITKELDK